MSTDIPARRPRTGVMLPRDLEASAVLPFARRAEALRPVEEGFGEGEAVGHGLARARLGRDEKVAPLRGRLDHRILNGCGVFVVTRGQSSGERGRQGRKGH